jgi:ABC-type glutathione transport system ATPase component
MALMGELRARRGLAMLLVSHDLASIAAHADTVLVLRAGAVVERGAARAVCVAPRSEYGRALRDATPRLRIPSVPASDARHDDAPPLVAAQGACVRYAGAGWRSRPIDALQDAEFSLPAGGALAIIGGSGSGKSTLGRAIAGIGPLTAGSIAWRGEALARRGRRSMTDRRRIQPVFQDPAASLDPRWRVDAVVAEPLRWLEPHCDAATRATRVQRALHNVELDPALCDRPVATLSGGQAQRVAIARALIVEPELLVLDEATSALDVVTAAAIIALLGRLRAERALTLIWITHDLAAASQLCDQLVVMDAGRIVEAGDLSRCVADPQHAVTRALVAASR